MPLSKQKKQSTPNWLTELPQGLFIRTEKGHFYVQSDKSRYYFLTDRVLDSWAPQRIIEVSEDDAAVRKLIIMAKMRFRNGSLLYHHGSGSMFLVADSKLRRITNPLTMELLNLKRQDAVWISDEELNLHEMGQELK